MPGPPGAAALNRVKSPNVARPTGGHVKFDSGTRDVVSAENAVFLDEKQHAGLRANAASILAAM